MTKHRDENKCRRQAKCKWLPKSGKLTSRYERANKPKIKKKRKKKKEKKWWERRGKTNNNKKTTKSQQSNRLQSATKEWMITVIRAQSKNNCANDRWKAKLTITNSN